MQSSTERTGVMVLRAWTEGDPPSLRVRITSTTDAIPTAESVTIVATSHEASQLVRSWLDALAPGTWPAGRHGRSV